MVKTLKPKLQPYIGHDNPNFQQQVFPVCIVQLTLYILEKDQNVIKKSDKIL